jgi:hypothetical protein
MDMRYAASRTTPMPVDGEAGNESPRSSVSWSAVIAGAVVSAALALVLLILCVGLQLSTVSPWVASASPTMLGVTTIIAAILVQFIASAIGGYLAGRLRTKWVAVHDDEVYFRDTAHGLLVWALATVVTAACLTSAASTAVGATAFASPNAAMLASAAAAPPAAAAQPPGAAPSDAAMPATVTPPPPAAGRVRATPDELQRMHGAAAQTALWTFVALLVGAFSASAAATIGGRQRDRVMPATRAA